MFILFLIYLLIIFIVLLPKNEHFTDKNNIPIIYINLDHRVDRRFFLEKQLKDYGFNNIHRISATYTPYNGHKGCAHSHYRALQYAYNKGYEKVLILEDDFQFLYSNIKLKLNKMPHKFNVILLSASFPVTKPYNKYFNKIIKGNTTSGYIIHRNYIPKVMNLFKKCYDHMDENKTSSKGFEHWAIDQKWVELQEKDNWLIFHPPLGKQNNMKSSIQATTKYY